MVYHLDRYVEWGLKLAWIAHLDIVLDSTTALLVGRPTSISDAHTDTKEPANLDDEEVDSGDFDPKGHSLMHPTEYTQVILRHRLAEIMGRISDHSKTVFQVTLDHADSASR